MIDDRQAPDTSWQDSTQVAAAGGVAALALIGLLVYAVVQVSHRSAEPPPTMVPPTTSVAVSSTSAPRNVTSTSSYRMPSPQTTEMGPQPTPPRPSESQDPTGPTEPTEPTEPTTIDNPYTTTTTANAGHV